VFYNVFTEFVIPMKLVRLRKMCLNETCSGVRVDKQLSDMFAITNGLKQGGALSPLLFNFAIECALRRVQLNQSDLNLNGTHHLLVCADDVSMLGESLHTVEKNTEALLVSSKEIAPGVNADKTKYMVMSCDQNSGRSHSIKTDNSSCERVEELKYLGTALTNQNSI